MGHFFSKVSLFIDKKEAAAHLILDQDFATAPFSLNNMYLFRAYFRPFNLPINSDLDEHGITVPSFLTMK